jgi:nucleotide-binding universal stress UspA family protein
MRAEGIIAYPKKVLLATDGTEDSMRAARAAFALVGNAGAEMHVVHVGQSSASVHGAEAAGTRLPGEPPGYAERAARKLLDRQAEEIRAAGVDVAGAHLRMDRRAAEVVALAEQLGVDLLVVGSGGPRPMRRAVAATARRSALGRASDTIVRSAHCPVLVVRGEGLFEERPESEKREEGTT